MKAQSEDEKPRTEEANIKFLFILFFLKKPIQIIRTTQKH